METFSLLKYWRGGGATTIPAPGPAAAAAAARATIISPTVSSSLSDSEEEGSFFDLEFAMQDDSELSSSEIHLSSASDLDILQSEPASPSTDLFFKGDSIIISSDPDTKPLNQFPVSLVKSATKIRVFLLGLKKSRSAATDPSPITSITSPKPKLLIVSLFSRDAASKQTKSSKEEAAVTAEEKKFAKEVVLKYLNKIRPLYVRVSKRYGDKLRFPTSEGEETDAEPEVTIAKPPPPTPSVASAPSPAKKSDVSESDSNNHPVVVACGVRAPRASMPAGIKQVYKRLGKSRSASAAAPAKPAETAVPQRRDDSLLQQEDGIQSAIAHCKRSFNSSSPGSESPLQRSMSDPGDGRPDKGSVGNSA